MNVVTSAQWFLCRLCGASGELEQIALHLDRVHQVCAHEETIVGYPLEPMGVSLPDPAAPGNAVAERQLLDSPVN